MNAIPPGLPSPVTIGVLTPVLKSVLPTKPKVPVSSWNAVYAAPMKKYGVVILNTVCSSLSAKIMKPSFEVAKAVSSAIRPANVSGRRRISERHDKSALARLSGEMDDDQLAVALRIEHKLAKRIENHRIGILQVERDRRTGEDVGRRGLPASTGATLSFLPSRSTLMIAGPVFGLFVGFDALMNVAPLVKTTSS